MMIERRFSARTLTDRMFRAAQLDITLYEEVEHDLNATSQAALVVLIVAVMSGLGWLRYGGIVSLILGIAFALVGWVIWSLLTYWVGKKIFATAETEVTPGQMLRTIGFAQSPGVLNVFGFVPALGVIVHFVVGIWVLVAGIIAIRQAMDFSTGRAIGTAVVSYIPLLIIQLILFG